jgi:hypothetical protein
LIVKRKYGHSLTRSVIVSEEWVLYFDGVLNPDQAGLPAPAALHSKADAIALHAPIEFFERDQFRPLAMAILRTKLDHRF